MIDAEELFQDFDDTAALPRRSRRVATSTKIESVSIPLDYRPLEWGDCDEAFPFTINEWATINAMSISPRIMSRHFLITGETGSGKTVSAVKPLLQSALNYRAGDVLNRASVLVIDPKHELQQTVRDKCASLNRPSLLLGQSEAPRVRLFEGFEGRSPAESVAYALDLCSPAFVAAHRATDSYWHNSAQQIITTIFTAKEAAYEFGKSDLWEALEMNTARPASLVALAVMPVFSDKENFFAADLAFCQLIMSHPRILEAFASVCRSVGMEPREYAKLTSLLDSPEGQRGSELSTAILYLTELAEGTLNRCVDLNPGWRPGSGATSVREAIENGVAIVFSPDLGSSGAEVAGRVLKTKYFEAAFCRSNKHRPMFYICDEFQRFITSDPKSGEQAFLDRCRAFRVSCVLATQSLAAVKNRIAQQSTDRSTDVDTTLNILLGNTGNKLFFRSTERDTLETVARLMPQPRTQTRSAVQLRPPSQLAPGECYYVFADGSAGRGHINVESSNTVHSEPRAIVRLLGRINMRTALATQDAAVEAAAVQLAREVEIEIDVCGGDPQAVRYLISSFDRLRDCGLRIATTGLAVITGGGALMLSLGDVGCRSAYPHCQLHFRSSTEDPRFDRAYSEDTLEDFFSAITMSEAWARTLVHHLFGERGFPNGQFAVAFDHPELEPLALGYSGAHTFDALSYMSLYRRLCAIDRPILPTQAIRLGLLDRICI